MAGRIPCRVVVLTPLAGRRVGVPVAQLKVVTADHATRKAVEDRHYWLGRGTVSDFTQKIDEVWLHGLE